MTETKVEVKVPEVVKPNEQTKVEVKKVKKDLKNEVLIGKKENSVYEKALLIQLNTKDQTEVILCSMGKNTEKAVFIAFSFIQRYSSFYISKAYFGLKDLHLEQENKDIKVKELRIVISKNL